MLRNMVFIIYFFLLLFSAWAANIYWQMGGEVPSKYFNNVAMESTHGD